ncbi:MAG TPA: glycosyltransferase family 39 protein [Vicinamibacterales bacterium]|nr:glycosyltransferase family 39 protein [Vicinamibacterales bacterium]
MILAAKRAPTIDAAGRAGAGSVHDSRAQRVEARWRLAARLLLAVTLVVIVVTFRDYGMTWDEEHSATNGKYWIDWYSSWFTARSILSEDNQRLYGSFFNGISRLIADRSPLGLYESGHLVTALTGWLALWGANWLARRLMGARAGFFAVLILVLTPGWYGQTFNNPKDVPFATLFLLSLGAILAAYRSLPRPTTRQTLLIGVVIGLALGVRVGAIVLVGCYAWLFACWAIARAREDPAYLRRALGADIVAFSRSWAGALLTAWLVMLPWWPYAQRRPFVNMWKALRAIAHFEYVAPTLYDGALVGPAELPWHYLPRWFAITLPDFYAVILPGVALALVFDRLRSRKDEPQRHLQSQLLFVLVAMLGLPVVAILTHAVMYDAYRHFLFVLPLLAVVTGCGLSWLLDRPFVWLKVAVAAPAVVLAALTLTDMVALHPFQSVYFNRLHGGLSAAFGRYETDYWAASHREGVEWLAAHYRQEAPAHSIRVTSSAGERFAGYYIRAGGDRLQRFVTVEPDRDADVVLSITRWNLHQKYPGRIVHTVERMGVPLLYVIEMHAPAAAEGESVRTANH